MHHVLTLPRLRRRDDVDAASWAPATESAPGVETEAALATHQVMRRVDGVGIASVVKLALLFYGFVFTCLAGGVLIVWGAISTMGYVDRFEEFMRDIGFRGFEVSSGDVVVGLIGIAGSLTLLATFLTVTVAGAYNVAGHIGQGLVLRMSEPIARPEAPAPAPAEDGAPHAA